MKFIFLFLTTVLAAVGLHAQTDNSIRIIYQLKVFGGAQQVDFSFSGDGGTFNPSWNATTGRWEGTTGYRSVVIRPGESRSFQMDGWNFQSNPEGTPATYRAQAEFVEIPGYDIKVEYTGDTYAVDLVYGSATWNVTLTPKSCGSCPVGIGASLETQERLVTWRLPLGTLNSGQPAGTLLLAETALESAVDRSQLRFASTNPEIIRIPALGSLRQILLPDTFIDAVDVPNGISVRVFDRLTSLGTIQSDGTYSLVTNTVPVISYEIVRASTSRIQVTERTYLANQNPVNISYPLDKTATGGWTKTKPESLGTVSTFQNVDTETRKWINASNVTEQEVQVRYGSYGSNPDNSAYRLPVEERVGGNSTDAFVTYKAYFPETDPLHLKRLLKWTIYPGGGFTRYDYMSGDGQVGLVYKEYRPFKNAPASPDVPTATLESQGVVDTYTYTTNWNGVPRLISKKETRIQGILAGQTDYSYDWSQSANSRRLVTTTRKDYTSPGQYLTTITRRYVPVTGPGMSSSYLGKPYAEIRPDGTQTSYHQLLGDWANGVFTETTLGKGWYEMTIEGMSATFPGAVALSQVDGKTIQTIYIAPQRSTATRRYWQKGRLMSQEQLVANGAGAFELVERLKFDYDSVGNLKSKIRWDPVTAQELTLFQGVYERGRIKTETSYDGTTINYTYDADFRLVQKEIAGIAGGSYGHQFGRLETYVYDSADRMTYKRQWGGATCLETQWQYGLNGKVTAVWEPGRFPSRLSYTFPTGGGIETRIERGPTSSEASSLGGELVYETQTTNRDGTTASVGGSAAIAQTSDRIINSNSTITFIERSGVRERHEQRDWLGRSLLIAAYGGDGVWDVQETRAYNTLGLLSSITRKGLGSVLRFHYDIANKNVWKYLDINANAQIDWNGTDRIEHQGEIAYYTSGGWWWRQQSGVYDGEGSSTWRHTYAEDERLSGKTSTVLMEQAVFGNFQEKTSRVVTIDSPFKRVTETVIMPGMTSGANYRTWRNGRLEVSGVASGQVVYALWDAFGRSIGATRVDPAIAPQVVPPPDDRLGSSISYWVRTVGGIQYPTSLVSSQSSLGHSVQTTYNEWGLPVTSTANTGLTTRFRYNARGQVTHQWGNAASPVWYEYDAWGARTKMYSPRGSNTWSNPTADTTDWNAASFPSVVAGPQDITTWNYNAYTGLLTSKVDAANKTTTFAYNVLGQLLSTVNANAKTLSREYFPLTGEIKRQYYSDGTPEVQYTYTRGGQPKTITDRFGTRTYFYDAEGFLRQEQLPALIGDRVIDWQRDGYGRRTQMGVFKQPSWTTNPEFVQTYGYNANTLPASVSSTSPGTGSSTWRQTNYSWFSELPMVSAVANDTWGDTKRTYTLATGFNRYGSSTNKAYSNSVNVLSTSNTFNTYGRISFIEYKNDDFVSEPAHRTRLFVGSLSDQRVSIWYGYTDRGFISGESASYRKNGVDTDHLDNLGGWHFREGKYDLQGNPFFLHHSWNWWNNLDINNLNQLVTGHDPAAGNSAPVNRTFVYDNEGNMTSDGWDYTYEYDAENRLIRQVQAGTGRVIEHRYDYAGRRVEYVVSGGNAPEWKSVFIYDGWNIVAEYREAKTATTLASPVRTYAWGLDVSQTFSGAGGVGGLAVMYASGRALVPLQDDRGNIFGYRDPVDGSIIGWDMSSYGDIFHPRGSAASGAITSDNLRLRHRSKWHDEVGGLIYYGKRFYHPKLGRFINRDPIQEAGGRNLYAMTGSDTVNSWDMLGMIEQGDPLEVVEVRASIWEEQRLRRYRERSKRSYYGGMLDEVTVTASSLAPSAWKPNKADCDALRRKYPKISRSRPGDEFNTEREAVLAGYIRYLAMSIRIDLEIGFAIGKIVGIGGAGDSYTYGPPLKGNSDGHSIDGLNWKTTVNGDKVAFAHTHGAVSAPSGGKGDAPADMQMSPEDKKFATNYRKPLYLGNPGYTISKFDPNTSARNLFIKSLWDKDLQSQGYAGGIPTEVITGIPESDLQKLSECADAGYY